MTTRISNSNIENLKPIIQNNIYDFTILFIFKLSYICKNYTMLQLLKKRLAVTFMLRHSSSQDVIEQFQQ